MKIETDNNLRRTLLILSKELALIGLDQLTLNPYEPNVEDPTQKSQDELEGENQRNCNVFLYLMMELVERCFEMVKRIKKKNMVEQDDVYLLKYDNRQLQSNIEILKTELKTKDKEILTKKEEVRQLTENHQGKEKKLKLELEESKKENGKLKRSVSELKVSMNKKEVEIHHLSSLLWKKTNVEYVLSAEDEINMRRIERTHFSALWSDVKFADSPETRLSHLKQAVSKFETVNHKLREENLELRNLIFIILKHSTELIHLFSKQINLKLNFDLMSEYDMKRVVLNNDINLNDVKNYFNNCFNLLDRSMNHLLDRSFSIGDDLFLCWSDIVKLSF